MPRASAIGKRATLVVRIVKRCRASVSVPRSTRRWRAGCEKEHHGDDEERRGDERELVRGRGHGVEPTHQHDLEREPEQDLNTHDEHPALVERMLHLVVQLHAKHVLQRVDLAERRLLGTDAWRIAGHRLDHGA